MVGGVRERNSTRLAEQERTLKFKDEDLAMLKSDNLSMCKILAIERGQNWSIGIH